MCAEKGGASTGKCYNVNCYQHGVEGGFNETYEVEANATVYLDQRRLRPFLADVSLQSGNLGQALTG